MVFLFTMLPFACEKTGQSRRFTTMGINGETTYIYSQVGNKIFAYKKEYYNDDYAVLINSDSIRLGEDLKVTGTIPYEGSKFYIFEPYPDTIVDFVNTPYVYHPGTTGEYSFRGLIVYDSFRIPILYKFLVVK